MPGGRGNIKPEDGKPFVKGDRRINRKGTPKKIPKLEQIFEDVFGDNDKMKAIIQALEKKAKSGDNRAAELLMDRVYGKLTEKKEIDLGGNIIINLVKGGRKP